MAIGMIELQGFGPALAVADKMCKAADISIDAFDANNPSSADVKIPVIVQVKFQGGVSDVYAALEAGRRAARYFSDDADIVTHCIPAEDEELVTLIKSGKLMPAKAAAVEPAAEMPDKVQTRAKGNNKAEKTDRKV